MFSNLLKDFSKAAEKKTNLSAGPEYVFLVHRNLLEYSWGHFKILLESVKHRAGRVLSFFSSRRNWDSPNPSSAGECVPPGSERRGTLAGERGGGRVPIPTRGHTLWYSLYVCNLWC